MGTYSKSNNFIREIYFHFLLGTDNPLFWHTVLPYSIFSLLVDIIKQLQSKAKVDPSGTPLGILPYVSGGFIKNLIVFTVPYFSSL